MKIMYESNTYRNGEEYRNIWREKLARLLDYPLKEVEG